MRQAVAVGVSAWSLLYAGLASVQDVVPVPAAVALGVVGAAVGLAMLRPVPVSSRPTGRRALLAYAWGMAAIAAVTPDLPLSPPDAAVALGCPVWVAAALLYARRTAPSCRCGDARWWQRWTAPDVAARWGSWSLCVALVLPLVYELTRPSPAGASPLVVAEVLADPAPGLLQYVWLASLGGAVFAYHLCKRPVCERCAGVPAPISR